MVNGSRSPCANTLVARYILLQPDGPPPLQPASNYGVDPKASVDLPEVVTNSVVLACTILPHCDCSLLCVRTGTKMEARDSPRTETASKVAVCFGTRSLG